MIKEIIVVEGKDDTVAVQRSVHADTIETGGSAIDQETIDMIRLAQERRGVIIFTDPDHPGERIRKLISAQVPGCKHAFLNVKEAKHKGKVGVEYASPEMIRKALYEVRSEIDASDEQPLWTMKDMMSAGLVLREDAAIRREKMGQLLRIGMCNGKQFLKRCNQFKISHDEFEHALNQLEKEVGI